MVTPLPCRVPARPPAGGWRPHADHQRHQAIEHITELLERLHEDKLDDEHSELDGCRDAIDKATAILLDQGKLGVSLGLDSAVHAINTTPGRADRRLARWRSALDKFPGVDDQGGTFRAHLGLAALALALKRRVIVLQAVEHVQNDPGHLFESFTRVLRRDQQRLGELESGIAGVLVRLSALELARPNGLRPVFMPGEVDRLMRATHRIHQLDDGITVNNRATDVAIEIAGDKDGSVVVFPALPSEA